MIIENGYFDVVEGADAGKRFPCNLQISDRGLAETDGGTYTQGRYTALVDGVDIEADGIRLFDRQNRDLGLFRVDDIRRADSVGGSILQLIRFDN